MLSEKHLYEDGTAVVLFGYDIVPRGESRAQPLMQGSLYIADVERAKRYVQTVTVPGLSEKPSNLEVVLRDRLGHELWRGPYLGSRGNP